MLQLGKGTDIWTREIAPTLNEFVASTTWEEISLQHLWRRVAADLLPVQVARMGRWWDGQDEIDLIGLWHDRVTLVGECKWTIAPIDEGVLATLERKARKLPLGDAPLWVLAGRSGFTPGLRRLAAGRDDLLLLEPATLFA